MRTEDPKDREGPRPVRPPDRGQGPRRLTQERLQVSWVALLFALLVGTTMAYVPHEFGNRVFRWVYPHLRLLGFAFSLGGGLMAIAALYPRAPRAIDLCGRAVFLGALGVYWWWVTVIPGGLTGRILYPVMAAVVIAEAWPRLRGCGLFRWFVAAISLAFGLAMLALRDRFPAGVFGPLLPTLHLVGAAFLLGGATLALIGRDGAALRTRAVYAALAVPFAVVAYTLCLTHSWSGMVLYLSMTVGLSVAAIAPRVPAFGLRHAFVRALVVSAVAPLLVLGGLACAVAQRDMERAAREELSGWVASEADWLAAFSAQARRSLEDLALRKDLLEAAERGDPEEVQALLLLAANEHPYYDAFGIEDERGERVGLPAWPPLDDALRRRALDDRGAVWEVGGADAGPPAAGSSSAEGAQAPVRVLSRLLLNDRRRLLVGALALNELRDRERSSPRRYPLEVVDRRTGRVVFHEARPQEVGSQGSLLDRAELSPAARALLLAQGQGSAEAFLVGERRSLLVFAPVLGTEWMVVSAVPVREALAAVTQLGALILAAILLTGLVSLAIAAASARALARPVERVRAAAETLAAGDLSRRVEPREGDPAELVTLAAAFNAMSGQLERAHVAMGERNAELRVAVGARDEALEVLERTHDELRAAGRRKDQFLAMLGHELRNPLAAVSNALYLLEHRRSAERSAELVQLGRRQMVILSRLVDDLLDVSRIERGAITLRREPVDLGAILRAAVAVVGPQSAERQVQLMLHDPAEPLTVRGDATRLEQVFVNLLTNAIKFTPSGKHVRVTCRTERRAEARWALVEVTDEGRGIAPDLVGRVFDLFVQEDQSIDRAGGGLGLGLTLVRSLLQAHGGAVSAASLGPGQGSTFTVELPLLEELEGPQAVAPTTPGANAPWVALIEDEGGRGRSMDLLEVEGQEGLTPQDDPAREAGPQAPQPPSALSH